VNRILNESELEVGSFYWVRLKGRVGTEPTIVQCKQDTGNKYLGNSKMWATDDNPQAFKTWDIQGPIPYPSESSWMDLYRIWSFEHDAWWKPNSYGYTPNKAEAGIYNYRQAKHICDSANYGGKIFEEMRRV